MITPIETQRLAEAFEIPGPMAVEDAASFQRWSASWAMLSLSDLMPGAEFEKLPPGGLGYGGSFCHAGLRQSESSVQGLWEGEMS